MTQPEDSSDRGLLITTIVIGIIGIILLIYGFYTNHQEQKKTKELDFALDLSRKRMGKVLEDMQKQEQKKKTKIELELFTEI